MVLAVNREPVGFVAFAGNAVRDPEIAPDNGLYAVGDRVRVKAQTPEDIHVVRDPERHLAAFGRGFQNRIKPDNAVGDRIFRVKPQVDKLVGHSR